MKKFITVLFALFLISGCAERKVTQATVDVAVSILPQQYFVKRIAGNDADITVMVPPGASPEIYEPTPAQLVSLSNSDLYMKIGYIGFEQSYINKLSSANSSMKTVNLSEGIELIVERSEHNMEHNAEDHHHGGIDPHTWISPKNVRIIAENTYRALADTYPDQIPEFRENLDVFLEEIDSLDQLFTTELSDISSRSFFIYHPALTYLARDYNLEQYPLEIEGKSPSPSYLKNLIDLGVEERIGVVFIQMQFDQRNADLLAKEIGAKIVQINPLDPDWSNQMFYICKQLKENLK